MMERYWLTQEGPGAAKHHGWRHPIATVLVHYAIVFVVTLCSHDMMMDYFVAALRKKEDNADHFRGGLNSFSQMLSTAEGGYEYCDSRYASRRLVTGSFLFIYAIWLLLWRLVFHQPTIYRHCVLYEYCWLCNVTLSLSAVGLVWNRPIVAGALCVVVGIDQLLWYVDLAVFFATGRFPVGVCKFVFEEGQNWKTRITATHHLWTIPIVLHASGGLHVLSFPLSVIIMTANVLLSRWMTPSLCTITATTAGNKKQDDGKPTNTSTTGSKYLNVNLSHALWKDIKLAFLVINHDCPPVHVYLFRLLWRWQAFNALVFCLLYYLSGRVYGPAPIC